MRRLEEEPYHFSRELLTDPINLANLRHIATLDIRINPESASYYGNRGILSKQEIKLCFEDPNFVLPSPLVPTGNLSEDLSKLRENGVKLIDPALRDMKVGVNITTFQKPCFFVDGVFDVFHGGHYKLVKEACDMAKKAKPNPGLVFVTLQPDGYIRDYKYRRASLQCSNSSWMV